MACATALASVSPKTAPFSITLFEAKRTTGGRAGSFRDPNSGQEIDYCQHVGMGCCTNLLHLLQLTKLDAYFERSSTLTFIAPGGSSETPVVSTFAPSAWLPSPLHLAPAFGRLKYLSRAERNQIRRALWSLMRLDPKALPNMTMGQWLRHHGQTDSLLDRFWNLILASALGDHVDAVAIGPARKVFVDGFLRSHGASDLIIPQRSLSYLFGQRLPDHLTSQGVTLHTGCRIRQVDYCDAGEFAVTTETGEVPRFDAVVIAVGWQALEKTIGKGSIAHAIPQLSAITRIPASTISGIHLWLDRDITPLRHAVLVGTLSQWLFRVPRAKSAQLNSTTPSSPEYHYQVVVSASHDLRKRTAQSIEEEVLRDLQSAFPETSPFRCVRSRVISDPQAVYSIRPDVQALRPLTTTSLPKLFLAGDYVQTGWPATMEGAILSGFLAADTLCRSFDLPLKQAQPPQRDSWLGRILIRQEEQIASIEGKTDYH
jgi:squalene-associated FAD-dependent desaturase